MNGRYRYSFWGEIYDIVLAFHLVLPTLVTMIFPKRGKFNVTDKGGLLDVGYFDFTVVRPAPGGGLPAGPGGDRRHRPGDWP